jgi:hypothetical protein
MATGGSTSAIAVCGSFIGGTPPNAALGNVETWDGTSWTETTEVNQVRKNQHGVSGSNADDALAYGGNISPPGSGDTAKTEIWNGSTWTEVADLATARAAIGAAGTSISGLAARGTTPPATNATEHFIAADFQIKTVTTS